MAPLIGLPTEALYEIFLNFEYDQLTLGHLARVCSRFHGITRALIIRHIGHLGGKKQLLLQRSLDENPQLRECVRSSDPVVLDPNGNVIGNSLERALRFPNLRMISVNIKFKKTETLRDYIRLYRGFGMRSNADFICRFLDFYTLGGIQTVRLNSEFTTTETLRFMLLPDVKHLEMWFFVELKDPQLPDRFVMMKSGLTSLELVGLRCWSVSPTVMHALLSFCPSLRRLSCQIPVASDPCYHSQRGSSRVAKKMSPVVFNWVLEPVRRTLTELKLVQVDDDVSHDGSHMDFSTFPALRELVIDSCCLISPGKPSAALNEIYTLIPYRLQRLNLYFCKNSGIFNHSWVDEVTDEVMDPTFYSDYSWIFQFTSHKSTHFPHLVMLRMRDSRPRSLQPWHWAPWYPPENIAAVFRESGINLQIQTGQPDTNSETTSDSEVETNGS